MQGRVSPCAFLCIFIKPVHFNQRIPPFPQPPCSDPSLNIKLQHCVVMLRGEKRPASQKKTSESGT